MAYRNPSESVLLLLRETFRTSKASFHETGSDVVIEDLNFPSTSRDKLATRRLILVIWKPYCGKLSVSKGYTIIKHVEQLMGET